MKKKKGPLGFADGKRVIIAPSRRDFSTPGTPRPCSAIRRVAGGAGLASSASPISLYPRRGRECQSKAAGAGMRRRRTDQSARRSPPPKKTGPARRGAGPVPTTMHRRWRAGPAAEKRRLGTKGRPDMADYLSAATCCICSPSPSMPSRMTSPGLRNTGGFWPRPTPGGVPVEMMSPVCRLINWLR